MDFLINFAYVLLLLVNVLGIIFYPRIKNAGLRLIVFYFIAMLVIEIVARLLISRGHFNIWLYNLGNSLEIILFFLMFIKFYTSRRLKIFLKWGIVLYLLSFIVEYLVFFKGWNRWLPFSSSFGNMIIILEILYLFIEMFKSDRILYIHKHMIFWVALGVLFYIITALPLNLSMGIFIKEKFMPEAYIMQFIANIIMYICIIIGFIWNYKPYKLS